MTATHSEVHGVQPDVAGRACRALVCEQFVADGVTQATANVTFLNIDGKWYRLVVDHPAVFWRSQVEEPRAWAIPERRWEYPHVNLGDTGDLYSIDIDGDEG